MSRKLSQGKYRVHLYFCFCSVGVYKAFRTKEILDKQKMYQKLIKFEKEVWWNNPGRTIQRMRERFFVFVKEKIQIQWEWAVYENPILGYCCMYNIRNKMKHISLQCAWCINIVGEIEKNNYIINVCVVRELKLVEQSFQNLPCFVHEPFWGCNKFVIISFLLKKSPYLVI